MARDRLLNDPDRPACTCDLCTETASAWTLGGIVARIRAAVADRYVDQGIRDRARLYAQLTRRDTRP